MGLCYKRKIFTNEAIKRFAGDDGGIYIIQKNQEIVFIGESPNLRKELLNRLSCMSGDKIRLSFYFCAGPEFNPTAKAEELLQKHREYYGKMPEFNENCMIPDPFLLD